MAPAGLQEFDMSVSALLVHYGPEAFTKSALDTLLASSVIQNIVVVLHDSYSLERNPRAQWIESENRGYAAGLNLGVHHLLADPSTENILALNPDVRLDESQLRNLIFAHQQNANACTFPVLKENDHLLYGYRFSKFGSLQQVRQNAEWYSGACFVFTVDAWKKTGGFDETFFHYFEDYDFCARLRQAGLTFFQSREIVVEHTGKSGMDYPRTELPRFAVRNHLMALDRLGRLGPLTFLNVIGRQFLYLFRWPKGWRGIPHWHRGIRDFMKVLNHGDHGDHGV